MLDDKESNRLIAEYSSRAREYAEAVTRLRFADEASFLVACCEQACLLRPTPWFTDNIGSKKAVIVRSHTIGSD